MSGLRQLTRPGAAVSYNNAAFGVAGRLVEKVTGSPYEAALRELLLEPLDLQDTLFFSRDLVTRRFAIDHQRLQDGGTNLLPFGFPRATNPVGGLATTTRDLIAWARFHLGDGDSLLSPELARRMHEPTVEAPGWSQGDAVGISWLLSDVAGLRVVGHGGATLGQLSLFKIVPERGFALVSCTNCSPVGAAFNERIMQWAWETLLDAPIPEPETVRPHGGGGRAVLRPLRDRREPHRRHAERRRRLTARDRPAGSARRVGCRAGAGAAGSVPLPGGPCGPHRLHDAAVPRQHRLLRARRSRSRDGDERLRASRRPHRPEFANRGAGHPVRGDLPALAGKWRRLACSRDWARAGSIESGGVERSDRLPACGSTRRPSVSFALIEALALSLL